MGKPTTVTEVSDLVAAFPRVRANGVGHSWHRELFCSGEDAGSVNVLLHGVRSVLPPSPSPTTTQSSINYPRKKQRRSLRTIGPFARPQPPSTSTPTTAEGRVVVNTASRTVKVDAGVKLRDLLDLLANYDDNNNDDDEDTMLSRVSRSGGGKDGYTLPAFP